MKRKKLDAEPILRTLAEMRKSIPYLDQNPPRPTTGDGRPSAGGIVPRTAEEFEYAAVADALESLADDISTAVARANARAKEEALKIYYAAEELARDPQHANLIEHVEKMREAYLSQYGKPIPPNPNPKGEGTDT